MKQSEKRVRPVFFHLLAAGHAFHKLLTITLHFLVGVCQMYILSHAFPFECGNMNKFIKKYLMDFKWKMVLHRSQSERKTRQLNNRKLHRTKWNSELATCWKSWIESHLFDLYEKWFGPFGACMQHTDFSLFTVNGSLFLIYETIVPISQVDWLSGREIVGGSVNAIL